MKSRVQNTSPKTDSRAFGDSRSFAGDQADIPYDETVCPTCNGKGVIRKNKTKKEVYKIPNRLSDSNLPPHTLKHNSKQRPRVARHPMHLPSLDDDLHSEKSIPISTKSQCAAERFNRILEEMLRRSLMKLSSIEWDIKKEGLEECLQIAQNHPDELELHMNEIYRTMRYLLTNHRPRDTLFVCQIARRYFALLRSTCRPEFDQLVIALLVRTVDSSANVRCYVNDALNKMVSYMPTLYAIRPLVEKGAVHKNPLVRTMTIRLLLDIVTLRTPNALLTYPYLRESCQKVIECGARLLADNSLGTRAAAKNLFLKLIEHPEFNKTYESCNIDSDLKRRVDKAIGSMRERIEEDC